MIYCAAFSSGFFCLVESETVCGNDTRGPDGSEKPFENKTIQNSRLASDLRSLANGFVLLDLLKKLAANSR
ncbi:hypothetical protein CHX27_04955 [Flavobacterium aurantiibacter]|uniref:Uncharacterized protein n=1 Tax=Flavobacterium aurantiibacter TaxID=2023067 RepID=A0A255ZXE1_9FLAO|nr:hypothetical protein CHX27_04955 [Flavobacterium aurantiibacter]